MTEATALTQLAAQVLRPHEDHAQFFKIGLPGIQGMEAVLTILQDRCGCSHVGGVFLTAVDILLEKPAVVAAVRQQLSAAAAAGGAGMSAAAGQQQQLQHKQPLAAPAAPGTAPPSVFPGGLAAAVHDNTGTAASDHAAGSAAAGSSCEGSHAGLTALKVNAAVVQPAPASAPVAAAARALGAAADGWPVAALSAAFAALSEDATGSTAGVSEGSTAGSDWASAAASGGGGGGARELLPSTSAASEVQASDLIAHVQQQQEQQQARLVQQRQTLHALLFDPSEVMSASEQPGSTVHSALAAHSPRQQQQHDAQLELQRELSRASVNSSSVGRPRQVWQVAAPQQCSARELQGQQSSSTLSRRQQQQLQQQGQQQQQSPGRLLGPPSGQRQAPLPSLQQQEQLPALPARAAQEQQLQQTLQFARQPLPLQQAPFSPGATWQQWQASPSQQQHSPYCQSSPLALPQPPHAQPADTPPLLPPHGLQATPQHQQPQRPQAVGPNPAGQLHDRPVQQPAPPAAAAAAATGERQQRHRDDLQQLTGLLEGFGQDEAAVSEVLSQWLSGSEAATDGCGDSEGEVCSSAAAALGPYHIDTARLEAAAAAAAANWQQQHGVHSIVGQPAGMPAAWDLATPAHSRPLPGWQQQHHHHYHSLQPQPGVSAAAAGELSSDGCVGSMTDMPTAAAASLSPRSYTADTAGSIAGTAAAAAAAGQQLERCPALTPRSVNGPPSGDATAAGAAVQQPGSITVSPAPGAAAGDGLLQPLRLDIELAKVLGSPCKIRLEIQRDEDGSGLLSIAPTPGSDATAQRGVAAMLPPQQPPHKPTQLTATAGDSSCSSRSSSTGSAGGVVHDSAGQQQQQQHGQRLEQQQRRRQLQGASWVITGIQPGIRQAIQPASLSQAASPLHSRPGSRGGRREAGGAAASDVRSSINALDDGTLEAAAAVDSAAAADASAAGLEAVGAAGGAEGVAAQVAETLLEQQPQQQPQQQQLAAAAVASPRLSRQASGSAGAASTAASAEDGEGDAALASPAPPSLFASDTPAGFKFLAASRTLPETQPGLRYDAQDAAMDSVSILAWPQLNVTADTPNSSSLMHALAAGADDDVRHSQQQQQPTPRAAASVSPEPPSLAQLQQQQPQQQQQRPLPGESLELLGLDELCLDRSALSQVSLDLLAVNQRQSLELHLLRAAAAAAAAAAATARQQGQQQPCQVAGLQSLDLLPRQLLQSLQAVAAMASTAAAQAGSVGSASAPQHQRTSWLASRFGAAAHLQVESSVNMMLAELEGEAPHKLPGVACEQQQQQPGTSGATAGAGAAGAAGAADAAPASLGGAEPAGPAAEQTASPEGPASVPCKAHEQLQQEQEEPLLQIQQATQGQPQQQQLEQQQEDLPVASSLDGDAVLAAARCQPHDRSDSMAAAAAATTPGVVLRGSSTSMAGASICSASTHEAERSVGAAAAAGAACASASTALPHETGETDAADEMCATASPAPAWYTALRCQDRQVVQQEEQDSPQAWNVRVNGLFAGSSTADAAAAASPGTSRAEACAGDNSSGSSDAGPLDRYLPYSSSASSLHSSNSSSVGHEQQQQAACGSTNTAVQLTVLGPLAVAAAAPQELSAPHDLKQLAGPAGSGASSRPGSTEQATAEGSSPDARPAASVPSPERAGSGGAALSPAAVGGAVFLLQAQVQQQPEERQQQPGQGQEEPDECPLASAARLQHLLHRLKERRRQLGASIDRLPPAVAATDTGAGGDTPAGEAGVGSAGDTRAHQTLAAAEAAMQDALQQICTLSRQPEQQSQALLNVQPSEEQGHGQQQRQQQQQQQQQQQHAEGGPEPGDAATNPGPSTGASRAASPDAGRLGKSMSQSQAAAAVVWRDSQADAHPAASADAPTPAAPARAPAAAGRDVSSHWVRQLLQDSSNFKACIQAIAGGQAGTDAADAEGSAASSSEDSSSSSGSLDGEASEQGVPRGSGAAAVRDGSRKGSWQQQIQQLLQAADAADASLRSAAGPDQRAQQPAGHMPKTANKSAAAPGAAAALRRCPGGRARAATTVVAEGTAVTAVTAAAAASQGTSAAAASQGTSAAAAGARQSIAAAKAHREMLAVQQQQQQQHPNVLLAVPDSAEAASAAPAGVAIGGQGVLPLAEQGFVAQQQPVLTAVSAPDGPGLAVVSVTPPAAPPPAAPPAVAPAPGPTSVQQLPHAAPAARAHSPARSDTSLSLKREWPQLKQRSRQRQQQVLQARSARPAVTGAAAPAGAGAANSAAVSQAVAAGPVANAQQQAPQQQQRQQHRSTPTSVLDEADKQKQPRQQPHRKQQQVVPAATAAPPPPVITLPRPHVVHAASTHSSLLQSVMQQGSITDVPRQQGYYYLFNALKHRAGAAASAAQQREQTEPAQAAPVGASAKQLAGPPAAAANAGCSTQLRQQPAVAAANRRRQQQQQQQQQQQALGLSPESSSCSKHAVAGSVLQQPRQQSLPPHEQLAGSKKRSHGLSLRGEAAWQQRPPAPADGCSGSRSTAADGQQPQASCGRSRSNSRGQCEGGSSPAATRRSQRASTSSSAMTPTTHPEHELRAQAAHPRALPGQQQRQQQQRAAPGERSGGGRTSAGAVAAVAALRAAVAGLGCREWQQQDIHAWLCGLQLGHLLEQHLQQPQQPLLANPVRNGLLLAGIAEAVSHHSQLPAATPQRPVTGLAAARGNLLAAAARLGMVSRGFAAAAGAVAAARDNAVAGGSGAASSQLAERGSDWRSGASRGMSSSPLGAERHRAASPGGRSPSRSRRSPCACFTAAAAAATGACGFAAPAVFTSGACSCRCDLCSCAAWLGGSMAEHAVLQLLEGVLAGDAACQWGLLFALQQTYLQLNPVVSVQ